MKLNIDEILSCNGFICTYIYLGKAQEIMYIILIIQTLQVPNG